MLGEKTRGDGGQVTGDGKSTISPITRRTVMGSLPVPHSPVPSAQCWGRAMGDVGHSGL